MDSDILIDTANYIWNNTASYDYLIVGDSFGSMDYIHAINVYLELVILKGF